MSDSSPPTYNFHGPNTSHSKDNGLVIFLRPQLRAPVSCRTFHERKGQAVEPITFRTMPQGLWVHCTWKFESQCSGNSYANDKSKLISVKFVEDKELSRAVIVVVSVFLLFAAVTLCMTTSRSPQAAMSHSNPSRSSDWKMIPELKLPTDDEDRGGNNKQQTVHKEEKYSDENISRNNAPRKHERSADIHWGDPQPDERCMGFGAREYTANLENLPFFANWEATCMETPIKIHGVLIPQAARCERKDLDSE
uniref:Transmembrane protein n=1 Tax=Psilocybe cubensis TaxID=181762 RepID=A0A8H7XYW9_PSICU